MSVSAFVVSVLVVFGSKQLGGTTRKIIEHFRLSKCTTCYRVTQENVPISKMSSHSVFLIVSFEFFDGMVGDSYLSFGTSQNSLINMVPTKRLIRKCILKMA
jgi:hypothetical protein